jgi:opacity protein-like surface antigen
MYQERMTRSLAFTVVAGTLLVPPVHALAENIFSIYTGTSLTRNSDLSISRPALGTNLNVQDVKWASDPFKAAPYYGLRFTHFPDRHANWGAAFDFTHYKMYAKTDRVVRVDGTWNGAAADGVARMDQYVQRFEISHGVNVLSINAIYRWLDLGIAGGRLQPYAGVGLTHYRPHSENTVDNSDHETGYEASGFGYQLLGGARYQLTERTSAFVEARFNSGTAKVDIANGQAETPLRTFHAIAGIGFRF